MQCRQLLNLALVTASLLAGSHCLNLQSVREGGCFQPAADRNFDENWFNSAEFRFFVAGSKLNLFKIFQGRADFQKLRDDQFYYDSCIWVSQIVNGTTTVRAFNEIAGRATNIRFARHGLLTLNYTTEPIQTILGLEHTITLTDNKTYVFFSTCWTGTNERGWFTYSTKDLWNNEQWRKMIGEHAVSLGFNRRNFAFMKRTNCVEFPDY